MAERLDGARELANVIRAASGSRRTATEQAATVVRVDENGVPWVRIAGADADTPANGHVLVDVAPGQTVIVRATGGRLSIAGSTSSPAVGAARVQSEVRPATEAAREARLEAAEAREVAEASAGTATKYVTDTDDGVMVHPDGDPSTGWRIADVLELLKDGASHMKAWMDGATARLRVGLETAAHVVVGGGGMDVYGSDGTTRLIAVDTTQQDNMAQIRFVGDKAAIEALDNMLSAYATGTSADGGSVSISANNGGTYGASLDMSGDTTIGDAIASLRAMKGNRSVSVSVSADAELVEVDGDFDVSGSVVLATPDDEFDPNSANVEDVEDFGAWKCLNVVQFHLVATLAQTLGAGTEMALGTLPSGFRPLEGVGAFAHSVNRRARVGTSGTVYVATTTQVAAGDAVTVSGTFVTAP